MKSVMEFLHLNNANERMNHRKDRMKRDVIAFSLWTVTLLSALFMGIMGMVRLAGQYPKVGWAYMALCVGAAILFLYVDRRIRKGNNKVGDLDSLTYPLVLGGYIFGLSALFFMDRGIDGGVHMFFIFAFVTTPCFMTTRWEATLMLVLELLAYGIDVVLAFRYPKSVNWGLMGSMDTFLPMTLVAVALGIMCLLYTLAYRSQRVRLDKALREANAASEAKSVFLDNMSHEIRTPMNSILGMNEMILREETRPEIVEYALAIQRSGHALLSIINDVLDFSKLQDDKMEIIPIHYDVSSIINDMVNMAAQKARAKSLEFKVNVDKDIPQVLEGDEYHIRQAVSNILDNAIKFTSTGSVTLTIGFEKLDERTVLMKPSVTDTGIGIREEDLPLIFQPFEHIESSRTFKADGSGLGLAVVRDLLRLMGSDLKVESTFRKGSTFSFDIRQTVVKWDPIGDYARAYSEAAVHQGAAHHEAFQAPNARVVVVDDTDVNLLVFTNLLKKTKIRIDTATSGVEMLQMARVNRYDVIFLDHRMPGMDGIEAFHAMQDLPNNLNRNTPVIALTANAVLGARQMYIDEGFSDYLSKPVDTVRLERMLLEYLPHDLVQRGAISKKDEEPEPAGAAAASSMSGDEAPEAQGTFQNGAGGSPYAHIPGIDYDAAITHCGSEDTFVQALQIFYDTLDQRANDIQRYAEEKDIKNYTILVHALKSAARLVGALELSADAKHLEECGDKQDVAEIEAKTPDLLRQYRDYKEVLGPLFGKQEEDLPEMSVAELHELYEVLKELAAMFDLDNIDKMMERAEGYRIPDSEKEKFDKVKDCVTAADWGMLEQLLA